MEKKHTVLRVLVAVLVVALVVSVRPIRSYQSS